jgi:hypothetical protein
MRYNGEYPVEACSVTQDHRREKRDHSNASDCLMHIAREVPIPRLLVVDNL